MVIFSDCWIHEGHWQFQFFILKRNHGVFLEKTNLRGRKNLRNLPMVFSRNQISEAGTAAIGQPVHCMIHG